MPPAGNYLWRVGPGLQYRKVECVFCRGHKFMNVTIHHISINNITDDRSDWARQTDRHRPEPVIILITDSVNQRFIRPALPFPSYTTFSLLPPFLSECGRRPVTKRFKSKLDHLLLLLAFFTLIHTNYMLIFCKSKYGLQVLMVALAA